MTLVRRGRDGRSTAPATTSVEAIEDWLLSEAIRIDDVLTLFERLVWLLVAADLPLDRASLHAGTLHPQLFGFAWNWNRTDGLCDEVKVAETALRTDAYRRNPIYRVIEHGETFRGKTSDPKMIGRHPLMADLAGQGITEYVAIPLRSDGPYHNAATAATKHADRFSDEQLLHLTRVLRLFALHVERHIALRIAANVLDTYLGHAAGRRVLQGSIRRGAGEPIRAIIWASDLRGFTNLADRLDEREMIALLNGYFERLVGAVIAHDGEILKFIGDGLLAVFPHSQFKSEREAARTALAAAEEALAAVERLNLEPPPDLLPIQGWAPLRTGIGLHEGEVFFGNVGAPERLDFTVIGAAVNAASRVESLSKALHRAILITEPVARLLDRPLDCLGSHELRGVSAPVSIFSPRE